MSKRILWLDNDKVFLRPSLFRLELAGFTVTQVFSTTEALQELDSGQFDMLILDLMLQVSEDEEDLFPAWETNSGTETGFVFYKKFGEDLEQRGTKLMVYTIREDKYIRDKLLFGACGLEFFLYYFRKRSVFYFALQPEDGEYINCSLFLFIS